MSDVIYCHVVNGTILPVTNELSDQDAAYQLAAKVSEANNVFTLAKAVDFLASLGITGQAAVQVIRIANRLLK